MYNHICIYVIRWKYIYVFIQMQKMIYPLPSISSSRYRINFACVCDAMPLLLDRMLNDATKLQRRNSTGSSSMRSSGIKRLRSSHLQITIVMPSLSLQHHDYSDWESALCCFFCVDIVEPWLSSNSNVSVPPETTGHFIRIRCSVESGRFVRGRLARIG